MEITIGIPILCTLITVLIGILAFNRNRDNDVKKDASKSAVIETKLDNISQGVDLIRIDMKANEKRTSDIEGRLIRVEESAKQAHKRLDSINSHEREREIV